MPAFDQKNEKWWYLVLALLICFSFYFALGAYPLLDNNEGLYASIAKNMLLSKKFIIPHLNCVPYIEKPPLLYWLMSLSFSIFGFTASAARLITSSSAAFVCVAIIYFIKKINLPQIGITSAIIFASSIGVSIIARMVYFDMLFTALIAGTLLCLFYWYESQKKNILRLGYLFFGLAILTKGLVAGVLICGSFIMFLAWEGNIKRAYKALDPIGIAIFLAAILPWHIAAIIEHDGFARQYLFEEHFLRFLDQRVPHDYYHGPFYYYLPRIMIYLLPWSFFMPLIFWRNKESSELEQTLLRFSWCWFLVPLLFFSLSSAKANYYMIVSAPALAIILGTKLKYLITDDRSKIINIWIGTIFFIMSLSLGIAYLFFSSNLPINDATQRFLIITVIYGIVAGIAVITLIKRKDVALVMLAAFIIPIIAIGISWAKTIKDELSISAANVGIYLTEHAKNKPLYIYQDFENISALAFYAPNCFKIIDSKSSDLYYGEHLPKFKRWFVNKEELLKESEKQQVYVVVPIKKLLYFYQNILPANFFLLKNFGRLVVVSNRP